MWISKMWLLSIEPHFQEFKKKCQESENFSKEKNDQFEIHPNQDEISSSPEFADYEKSIKRKAKKFFSEIEKNS